MEQRSNDAKRIEVRIASDYYSASLTAYNVPDAPKVTEQQILSALNEKHISYGIDKGAIASALERLAKEGEVVNFVIAQGKPHKNGEDARIEYKFETKTSAKPEILEDGTVNFKNLGIVKSTVVGAVLAEKIPATLAVTGTTVTGKTIKGRDGKDHVLGMGKNTHTSDNGLILYSDINGRIHFDGKKVSVLSVMEIPGDVGVSTGNIDFIGSVVVNGNICDGYEVRTSGDLTVNGVVEGARLDVGGNLNISKGIKGHDEAFVRVAGNLITNFINSATINSKGNIEADAIMSSIIRCDGDIVLSGKKGQIVGGDTTCKGSIDAKVAGSKLEIVTMVKLGLDYEVVNELKELTTAVRELKVKSDALKKDMATLANKFKLLNDDRLKIKIYKYKKEYDEVQLHIEEKNNRLKLLREYTRATSSSMMKIGHLYPGLRLMIGSSVYISKTEMKDVLLHKKKTEIEVESF